MRHKGLMKIDYKILRLLAEKGEYGQYGMWRRVGSTYRNVMRRLAVLEDFGLVRVARREQSDKGGKERKIYTLTFKGFTLHLASVVLKPMTLFVIGSESREKTQKRIANERGRYLKEAWKLADCIEDHGKQLQYTIFNEIRWLDAHFHASFESLTLRELLQTARFMEAYFSNIQGWSNYITHLRKEHQRLEETKKKVEKLTSLKRPTLHLLPDGKEEVIDVYGDLMTRLEWNKKELDKAREIEDAVWRQFFAESFLARIAQYPLTGDSRNTRLRELAEQLLDKKRIREIAVLEEVSRKFS